ncbi:PREDICTED: uncharacterized protein C2orf16 homolog [Condylura cristata]|uniref:uncharacterized protein C2orf16 homolog n=1 Tax=Condylura cristata TaxID=143302 RepID=UPI0006432130|nr:PREDICTED: uncharacterized protein C2orf16 homolog [Condylura cristata]
MNCQELTSGWQGVKSVVMTSDSTKKFTPGPILTSVKLSNMSPESHQQGMKSLELIPDPKLQNVRHVELSSVSLKQTPNFVELTPGSMPQKVKSEELTPRINHQSTDSSKVITRAGHHFVDHAEMIPKPRHQVPKFVNLNPPTYHTSEPLEMAQSLAYQSTETVEISDKAMESSVLPLELDFQIPEFVGLTPVQMNEDLNFLELTSEKSYYNSDTLELLSQSESQVTDLGELHMSPLQQVEESREMTPEYKHHVSPPMELISEARLQKEEFLGMIPKSKPISKTNGHRKRSPRSYPQVLEPMEIISGERWQREESVALITKTLQHVPESSEMILGFGHQVPESVELTVETGLQVEEPMTLTRESQDHLGPSDIILGLGHQIPESVGLSSQHWLEKEKSLELSPNHVQSVELISETWQRGKGSIPLTQLQKQSKTNSEIAQGPLDQNAKFKGISPKSLNRFTKHTKTQNHTAHSVQATPQKIVESVNVTSGPPFQVVKSVTLMPRVASQMVEYIKSTSKLQNAGTSVSCLQNVKCKPSIREPAHQILEIMKLTGFQIVKSVLIPGPSLQIVNSEELAPGPIPQIVEPIGVTLGLGFEVIDCVDLFPNPYLREKVEPTELTPRSKTEVKSAKFTSQPTFPFTELTVLTHEENLQSVQSLGRKTEPPQVMKSEDLNLGQRYRTRECGELASEEIQIGNYFSRFLQSSSNSFISSSIKTSSEFGGLFDSEKPEVSRTLDTKNLEKDILQPEESFTGPFIVQSLTLPLTFHNQSSNKTGNTVETTHSEIPGVDIVSKERTKIKQVETLNNSLRSIFQHPPQSRRFPSITFHSRSGTQKRLTLSALGRQQNVWENHSHRQRLPRKYLSTMLMMGNSLGTTMEREFYSQMPLTERTTVDTLQSIQNLFGVPAELMEFSQIPLEKGLGAISQPSVVKNYIQRHTSSHGHDEKMTIRMWTRGSMSSIIRQYSGARMKIKKTNTKLSNISQEVIQHMPISYTECPAPVNYESSFNMFFNSKDPITVGEGENSQNDLQRRIFESQQSLKPSCLPQAKNDFSEQFQLLQDLQLKIAAKLLRILIPPNVPPPLASGLVLKYPICLQCGRCSGFNCCHKSQATFGPYLLIYPQLHLVSTPEGHGEIRLHLGFRLRTGKRPQVPKYHRKDRPTSPKSSTSPLLRKTKIHTRASKSPIATTDFRSGSSHSPPPVQVHIRRRQSGSSGLVGKTEMGKLRHYEFTQVYALSESHSESIQDGKWAKVRSKKTSKSKYPKKRFTKGVRTPSKKFYTNSRSTVQSPSRELPAQFKRKHSGTSKTTFASLKRQPKKSSPPKFIQLLFWGLKQAFQTAHKIVAFVGQKHENRTKPDHLWQSKNYHLSDYCLSRNNRRDKMSVVNQRPPDSTHRQESMLWEGTDHFRSNQQSKRDISFQPSLIQRPKSTASQRSTTFQINSVKQHLGMVQNDSGRVKKKAYRNEISSLESKNSKKGTGIQAQGRIIHGSPMKRTSHIHLQKKLTHKEQNHHSFYKERTPCNSSERSHPSAPQRSYFSPSQRSHLSHSQRSHPSPSRRSHSSRSQRSHSSGSQRSHLSPSQRSHPSHCQRSHPSHCQRSHSSPSQRSHSSPSPRCPLSPSPRSYPSPSRRSHPSASLRRCRSPSERRCRSPSERRCRSPSERRCRSPSEKTHHVHSEKTFNSPEKILHRPSERSHQNLSEKTRHNHSERSRHRRSDRIHHSPWKDILKHSSSRERPRHSLPKDFKSYPNMSSWGDTRKPQSWASLEA